MRINRRELLIGAAAVGAGASVSLPFFAPRYHEIRRPTRSRVAVLHVENYSQRIGEILHAGLHLFPLDLRDKKVVLKPNLVDYIAGSVVNTDPLLVAAAAECFRRLGAKEVVVAEGPGHQRDTQLVLCESGYASILRESGIRFIDLNRDELIQVDLRANYSGLKRLWLPKTVVETDFLVSMPKVKTHHWSGVTLSMKNLFGVVPGSRYGWPKNILHWNGIQQTILDICATVPVHFVIADAIIAMEGNGPLNGTPRPLGRIVLADDPVAADATCARHMGLEPHRIPHIREASKFLGNCCVEAIDQAGEMVQSPSVPFQVVPEFEFLRSWILHPK
ncbi:MAG TPA: DUF362 domain-containing protein [Candidatus Sulfotelmatobacter sp.]|nr:DUF362 domain-containing protein [Candidatus Sulfotelmatobacter sp.]